MDVHPCVQSSHLLKGGIILIVCSAECDRQRTVQGLGYTGSLGVGFCVPISSNTGDQHLGTSFCHES